MGVLSSNWWRRRDRRRLDPAVEAAVKAAYDHGLPIAESLARQSAEAGSLEGMAVYDIGLANRGAHPESERWLQRASSAGDLVATIALGTLYMDCGDFPNAEYHFRTALAGGHPNALRALQELQNLRAG